MSKEDKSTEKKTTVITTSPSIRRSYSIKATIQSNRATQLRKGGNRADSVLRKFD